MITSSQIRAGRHLANLSQSDIADATGLSLPTIRRAESEREVSVSGDAVAAIRAALEAAGVEFIAENGGGPGVRLMPYTLEVWVKDASGLASERPKRFRQKEDAISAARTLLSAAKQTSETFFNRRQDYWWWRTDVDTRRMLRFSGPTGPAKDDLNFELSIKDEEE